MIGFFSFDFAKVGGSSRYDDGQHIYKKIKKYGKIIDWLDERHYPIHELEKHRMIGDNEMDEIIELIYSMKKNDKKNENIANDKLDDAVSSFQFLDVLDVCKIAYEQHFNQSSSLNEMEKKMIQFYNHYYNNVPDWVDWDRIQNGMNVFITYSPVIGQSLYYLSLVPGFSIPKIAQVLKQTKYLSPPSTPKQIRQRLFDTGGFVTSCMMQSRVDDEATNTNKVLSASSLRPGGMGWEMALRVRVLHAKVRRMIMNAKDDNSNNWDVNEFGIPVNQEDMAATLLAFSTNVLSGVEFVAGVPLSRKEQLDYLSLWRYIGWLLGVSIENETYPKHDDDETTPVLDPCGSGSKNHSQTALVHSRAMLESIILHLMHPNDLSATISNHLLLVSRNKGKENQNVTTFACLYRSFMCRRFIGNELADALELIQPSFLSLKYITAYELTLIILMVLRLYTLMTIYCSWFRSKAYVRHTRLMNQFFLHWTKENGDRMKKAARMSMTVKSKNLSPLLHEKEEGSMGRKLICPFSLVMPPQGDDQIPFGSKKKN